MCARNSKDASVARAHRERSRAAGDGVGDAKGPGGEGPCQPLEGLGSYLGDGDSVQGFKRRIFVLFLLLFLNCLVVFFKLFGFFFKDLCFNITVVSCYLVLNTYRSLL